MNVDKFGIGKVEAKIVGTNFCEAFQTDAVKSEPPEIDIFTKCRSYCNSSSKETEFVDHKHATEHYQEQNEEKLDVKNPNPKDFHSKFSESVSTSRCETVQIKKEDIDIFYDDIKRECNESIRFCEVCYQSYGSQCSCEKQKESLFYNRHSEDVEPSSLELITDFGLQAPEVKDEITSGDEVTKEQDLSAISPRLSVPPVENDNKMKPLENNLSVKEKKIQCKMCSKSFCHRGNFKVHERGHTGDKPYQCKICSKAFSNSSHLRVHERIHTGERPFHCKICFKAFSDSSYLRVHERNHTGENSFHCQICSKSFNQMSNLKVHERVHTGEKPFRCKICPKAFTNSNFLKIHGRNHTGEKPFKCKICSKDFTTSSILKIHGKIHTREKFHCKFCSKSFSQIGNLKVHERSQHL